MKYALVIFESLKGIDHAAETAWLNATQISRDKTQKNGKVEVLNAGCFLCDLSSGLHDLGYISATATSYGIQSRTLFFDQAPPFVITKGKDA